MAVSLCVCIFFSLRGNCFRLSVFSSVQSVQLCSSARVFICLCTYFHYLSVCPFSPCNCFSLPVCSSICSVCEVFPCARVVVRSIFASVFPSVCVLVCLFSLCHCFHLSVCSSFSSVCEVFPSVCVFVCAVSATVSVYLSVQSLQQFLSTCSSVCSVFVSVCV